METLNSHYKANEDAIIQYNTNKFNFNKVLKNLFNVSSLENIHNEVEICTFGITSRAYTLVAFSSSEKPYSPTSLTKKRTPTGELYSSPCHGNMEENENATS